jgi:hypothetical protein
MAVSPEGKAARKIADTMNVRGLNNSMLAYFIEEYTTKEVRNELFDVFFHMMWNIANSEPPEYMSLQDAKMRVLADSFVRAVEESGFPFN